MMVGLVTCVAGYRVRVDVCAAEEIEAGLAAYVAVGTTAAGCKGSAAVIGGGIDTMADGGAVVYVVGTVCVTGGDSSASEIVCCSPWVTINMSPCGCGA